MQHLDGMQLEIWLVAIPEAEEEEGIELRAGVKEGKQCLSSLILTIVLAAFFGGRLIQRLSDVIGGC